MARWARRFVSFAALLLIAASLGSYAYHRQQMEAIAARHLRLVVVGPSQLQPGAPAVYSLLTTRVTGEPCAVPVEWSLGTPDGKLVDRKEPTDDQGRLAMTVDMVLPPRPNATAQLNIKAGSGDHAAQVTLPLAVRRAQYRTRLEVDRASYRPGETVYYRSLTVARYGLAAAGTLPLEFEILDAKSVPLPDSLWIGLTDRGIGNGSFHLPVSLAAGSYTLVARGADGAFPEQRLAFEVTGPDSTNAAAGKQVAKKTADSKAVKIDFFPEGGTLAAGLENRVYFSVRDAQGRPLEIRGGVINAKGDQLARMETAGSGRGKFSFVPDATGSYHVKIIEPAGVHELPPLPPASAEQKVAIAVKNAVLAPGAPLELVVHASKENIPIVVTASAGGLLIGQQLLITTAAKETSGTEISLPLDDRAAGVVCATVYDCSKSPPRIDAQRLVFRQPRPLVGAAVPSSKPSGDLLLAVESEKGNAVAAALSVVAIGGAKAESSHDVRPRLGSLHALLLGDDVPDKSAFEGLDSHVAGPIDLALACQNLPSQVKPAAAAPDAEAAADVAPVIFDNLDELRSRYEATLGEYRAQRTHVLNALIMLSFFGGLALALLVTMLAVMRIVRGGQLWLPTAVATLCCAIVTAVSNDSSRLQPVELAAVAFAPDPPPPSKVAAAQARPAAPTADSQLHRLNEKFAKFAADAEELRADRFPVQQYAGLSSDGDPPAKNGDKPLAWYPLLVAGPDGRVALPGLSAAAAKAVRLMIEAQDGGRIESCELSIK